MGRRKLYKAGLLTIQQMRQFDKYVKIMLEKRKSAINAMSEYNRFCQLNNLPNLHQGSLYWSSVLKYASALRICGMDPGSISTAIRMLEGENRRLRMPEGISGTMVKAIFEKEKAVKGTRRAPDATLNVLLNALSQAEPHECRTQLAHMLLFGVRNADLAGTGAMRYTPTAARCDVLISKQRASVEERGTLNLCGPLNIFGTFPADLQLSMRQWQRSGARQSLRGLPNRSHKKVGTVLRWMRSQSSLKKFTTYSFRRNYVHRIIDHFTTDGTVDWDRVTQLTLHFSDKLVRSIYSKMAAEYEEE